MAPPEGILFDFGGTLDADGVQWGQRFYAFYQAQGGKLPAPHFDRVYAESDRILSGDEGIWARDLSGTVAAQVCTLCRLLPDGARLDAKAWAGGFLDGVRGMVERNRELLAGLAGRYALGVVSNFFGNLRLCLDELGLTSLFSITTDSVQVGLWKPDPRIFLLTVAGLGLAPAACWMVGDNPQADIEPAAALGMRTCWLAPSTRPVPAGLAPTRRLNRLTDLTAALG